MYVFWLCLSFLYLFFLGFCIYALSLLSDAAFFSLFYVPAWTLCFNIIAKPVDLFQLVFPVDGFVFLPVLCLAVFSCLKEDSFPLLHIHLSSPFWRKLVPYFLVLFVRWVLVFFGTLFLRWFLLLSAIALIDILYNFSLICSDLSPFCVWALRVALFLSRRSCHFKLSSDIVRCFAFSNDEWPPPSPRLVLTFFVSNGP